MMGDHAASDPDRLIRKSERLRGVIQKPKTHEQQTRTLKALPVSQSFAAYENTHPLFHERAADRDRYFGRRGFGWQIPLRCGHVAIWPGGSVELRAKLPR